MSVRILQGDCMEVLKTLGDESVHCVVTSPPYWRQRDYGVLGQLGLESTPEEYIARLVAVFAECRRVLRSDGTAWINLGDKWCAAPKGSLNGQDKSGLTSTRTQEQSPISLGTLAPGYKAKDLIGVPWMLAFAMRADGWYLRQCNIWAKPNGMPESVRDRSTVSHEYVFQFSKSNDYWYDTDASRTPPAPSTETRLAQNIEAHGSDRANGGAKTNGPMKAVRRSDKQRGHTRKHEGFNDRWDAKGEQQANGSNLRSVWWIAPAQYREGHYAVMPDALAAICITAGCPHGGTCLDPFAGAGTTGLVADRLQRDAILIELNPEYAAMAERRIRRDAGMFAEVTA